MVIVVIVVIQDKDDEQRRDVMMCTSSSGKLMLNSDLCTEALNMLRKDPHMPPLRSNTVFAFMHICVLPVVDMATLRSTEASRFINTLVKAILPRADSLTSSYRMRLACRCKCGAYIWVAGEGHLP